MILNGEFFQQGTSPRWLIEGLLQRDTLTVVAAEPGSAKSLIVLGAVYHAHLVRVPGQSTERPPRGALRTHSHA